MLVTGVDPLETRIDYHPNLTVTKHKGGSIKPRRAYCINGLNAGDRFKVYNNSIGAMARAVNERLFYICEDGEYKEPPKPLPGLFDDNDGFTEQLDRLAYYATRMNSCDFAESYSGAKKVRYLKAVETLNRKGIERRDGYWKTFIKYEAYNFTDKSDPVPRGINPRSDVYLVELGSYLKPIEKRIYQAIDRVFGYKTILKGANNEERGRIISDHFSSVTNPVCIALDASRFEQSCSVDVLHWEHRRYLKYYPGDKHLRKLLLWQRHNRGSSYHTDGKLKFSIDGGRGSGDFNTGLGNNLINARITWLVMSRLNISGYRFFCDGDDGCIIVDRKFLPIINREAKRMFREYGFRMKLEKPAYDIERIDFCSARPVYDGLNYVMVRSPQVLFAKDTVVRHDLSTRKQWEEWAYAVGNCHLALGGGFPIQQAFALCLLKHTKCTKFNSKYLNQWKLENQWKTMTRKVKLVSDRTRYSYWLAFGVTPDEQIAIENYLQNLEMGFDESWVKFTKFQRADFSVPTLLPL